MSRSWRTTLFGYMLAIGGAITAAIRTGLLDGSKMPDWVNMVAGLCSIIGAAGLGQCARDHAPTEPPAPPAPAPVPDEQLPTKGPS